MPGVISNGLFAMRKADILLVADENNIKVYWLIVLKTVLLFLLFLALLSFSQLFWHP
jgi:hypothetical protein